MLVRALAVGLVCFILALAGFYLIFSYESWRYSRISVIYDGPYPNRDPFAGGEIFLTVIIGILIELILLPFLAGAAAALVMPATRVTERDLSRYAGLAGAIPLALVSIIYWAMFIADLIHRMMLNGGLRVPDQALIYISGMVLNVFIILAGAYASVASFQCVRAICRKTEKGQ